MLKLCQQGLKAGPAVPGVALQGGGEGGLTLHQAHHQGQVAEVHVCKVSGGCYLHCRECATDTLTSNLLSHSGATFRCEI